MYTAKCVELLIVLAALGVMWVLYRKKANQIMLAIALTIFIGGALRLFQIQDNHHTLYTVGAIAVVMAVIWLVSWLSNRAALRHRPARRVDPVVRQTEEARGKP